MTLNRFAATTCGLLLCVTTLVSSREARAADPIKPAAVTTSNVPDVPPQLFDRLRQYLNARAATFSGWSPDGKGILVRTRFANTYQLHRVEKPLGYRRQVTYFKEPVRGVFIPHDKDGDLLISRGIGGNENYQIFHFDTSTGQATMLTDGKSRNRRGSILKDGTRMIIASNKRNGRDFDLYIADTKKPGGMKMILETDKEYWYSEDWSSDRFTILINRFVSVNETYPALLDIVTGKKTMLPIPNKTGKAYFGVMKFAPDGKSIYITTDAVGQFRQLMKFDLKTNQYTALTPNINWNVTNVVVNRHTGVVAFTVNENGASALYFLGEPKGDETLTLFPNGDSLVLEAGKPVRVNTPLAVISGMRFSPDGKHLGFTLTRGDAPSDAWSISMETGKATQWTKSEVGGLDTSKFVRPEPMLYPTFDRVEVPDMSDPEKKKTKRVKRLIPAYYFKPPNATPDNPAPVVINIHGGPESQYRPFLSSFDQFLLNEMGIAVIRPNVRGSAGYGKDYLKLDNAEKREDSVRDIERLIDWIQNGKMTVKVKDPKTNEEKEVTRRVFPELDGKRVAVMGGSYGGYMVLASMCNYPKKIKCGIDIVGIASFRTFLKNTASYRRDIRRAEYGDERTPKMKATFARIDPLNNAHRISSPLFVAHGKNDPRVPFSEATQIAKKVSADGDKVWTVYADNEGHGFRKKPNRDYLYATIAMFLRRHLATTTKSK